MKEIGRDGEKVNTVTNYRAMNSKTHGADVIKEIASAEIVTCVVGLNILKWIPPLIANGIDARTSSKPLDVVASKNMIGATDSLRRAQSVEIKRIYSS